MRRNIAGLAARLMAQDGITDYGFAKRKAARQLGAPETEAMPTNAEVEAELRVYQSLYQADEHHARLAELRRTAIEVMELLADFTPYLTGAVLEGTAGRYAEVEIELFPASAKEAEIFLLNRRVPFQHVDARRTGTEAAEALLRLEWNDIPVSLALFPPTAERQQKKSPHSGRVYERARIEAVRALLREGGE